MKFTRELTGTLAIQSVTTDAIIVSGEAFMHPIALAPGDIISRWEPGPVSELIESHFDQLLAEPPELLILGTGQQCLFPPRELVFAFARRGIGLEAMDTAAAARTFNVLAMEGRRIAAVLYI